MKSICILAIIALLFTSCSEVSQRVTYDNGLYCVQTWTTGEGKHGFKDFYICQCDLDASQVEVVKYKQNKESEKYLKVAK